MIFKGQEQENGVIVLKAVPPLTCRQRLEAAAEVWLRRLFFAAMWFGFGLLVGQVWR